MTRPPRPSSSEAEPFPAYERRKVESFFASALDERVRLMGEIAAARRRIAEAKASLAEATDMEYSCLRVVLDAQRQLRGEQRANEKALAAIEAEAEAEAETILARARERAAAMTSSVHRCERAGDDTPDGPPDRRSNGSRFEETWARRPPGPR